MRETVNAALEQKRKDKVIGTSLGARVVLTAAGPVAALLDAHRADLPMLFIVSDLELQRRTGRRSRRRSRVEVEKAPGVKCERCWRIVPGHEHGPGMGGAVHRCVDALAEPAAR